MHWQLKFTEQGEIGDAGREGQPGKQGAFGEPGKYIPELDEIVTGSIGIQGDIGNYLNTP